MRLFDKYNCILCKYNKYNKGDDSCFNHQEKDEYGYPIGECKSLSNIYYGTLMNFFPFKQIDDFLTERAWRKENDVVVYGVEKINSVGYDELIASYYFDKYDEGTKLGLRLIGLGGAIDIPLEIEV